jgi:hypothetical protein
VAPVIGGKGHVGKAGARGLVAIVQVVYQHDDTTGLSYIDHRFTSLAHMPPEYTSWHSEKLVYMCCAWVDEEVTKVSRLATVPFSWSASGKSNPRSRI